MEIKISDELNAIINYARQEAMRTGSYGIAPDHFFLAIIRHGNNTACDVLKALETDIEEFKQFIDSRIFTNESIPYAEADHITFSRGAQNVLSITVLEASRTGSGTASSQHLLLALGRSTGGYGISYLRDIGIDYGRIARYLERNGMLAYEEHDMQRQEDSDGSPEDAGETESASTPSDIIKQKRGRDNVEAILAVIEDRQRNAATYLGCDCLDYDSSIH